MKNIENVRKRYLLELLGLQKRLGLLGLRELQGLLGLVGWARLIHWWMKANSMSSCSPNSGSSLERWRKSDGDEMKTKIRPVKNEKVLNE